MKSSRDIPSSGLSCNETSAGSPGQRGAQVDRRRHGRVVLALTSLGRSLRPVQGLELAREVGESGFIGLGLLSLAIEKLKAEDYLRARELSRQGVEVLEEAGLADDHIMMYSVLGVCEQALGNFDEGSAVFQKGLAISRKAEDTKQISSKLRNLFYLDLETGHLKEAEERVREYAELAQLTDDPDLKGTTLVLWAELSQESSEPEGARRHLLAALSHFQRAGMFSEAVDVRERLALVAEQVDDLDMASEHWAAIASAYLEFGNERSAAHALYKLGAILEEYRPEDAVEHYEKALSLYGSLGDPDCSTAEEVADRLRNVRERLGVIQ